MLFRRTPVLFALAAALAVSGAGCIFGPDKEPPPPVPPLQLLPPKPAENLIKNLQIIYTDKDHSWNERLTAYENLFVPGFRFNFQPVDYGTVGTESWGLDSELEAHRGLFQAQENGDVYTLELRITYLPEAPLDPPQQGREGWTEIFASNVYLRLMFNPNDGLEVNGGQAEFLFPPESNGRFYIGEWTDLPRP